MFKNRDWFVLGAVGAVALLLAYWGFSGCVGANCTPEPAWKVFEKSLHLVQGRGSFSIGTDPWQLVVAQYLVPGVAVLAAAKLFLLGLRRDLRVAFARKSSNHTVVCGLSETGLHIVENLRNAGERVVAIDLDSETPAAASCAHAGVPVLKGDGTDGKILPAGRRPPRKGNRCDHRQRFDQPRDQPARQRSRQHATAGCAAGAAGQLAAKRDRKSSACRIGLRERGSKTFQHKRQLRSFALSLSSARTEKNLVCFRASPDSPAGVLGNGRGDRRARAADGVRSARRAAGIPWWSTNMLQTA